MSAPVSRDPFARTELHREREYFVAGKPSCSWCGGFRLTPSGRAYLFRYSTQHDAGRTAQHAGLFCSKSCHDAYHG